METHFIKLSPANKDCTTDFSKIQNEKFNGIGIFEFAENYANNSDSFKRTGKKMKIIEIHPKSLLIRIISETSLQMVSKSLSGFSRELLRIDNIREEQGRNRLFASCVYNHSLFRSSIIVDPKTLEKTIDSLSYSSALKICIDLFWGDSTKSKEQFETRQHAIIQIKKILLDYKNKMEI